MTDKALQQILKDITIIIDSREQENTCITDYFDRHGIKYISRKLEYGDYSFICSAIPELNLNTETSFEKRICFERKNSLDELSGNIAQARERFERELQKAKDDSAKLILLVQDGSYEKIIRHEYRTDLNEKSYLASLFSFQARYDINIQFISEKLAGWLIYSTFKYFLREELVSGGTG